MTAAECARYACAEGALEIKGGKARLIDESYCDGLGACLSGCPQGAVRVIEREAEGFDPEAVQRRVEQLERAGQNGSERKELGPVQRLPVRPNRDLCKGADFGIGEGATGEESGPRPGGAFSLAYPDKAHSL